MSRKTLALIVGLVLVTIILFIIALRTGHDTGSMQKDTTMQATPTPVAASTLTLSPNPIAVVSGKQGEIQVMLDSSYNKVTSVQLELSYDPLTISNIKATPGSLFPNSIILIDNNDSKTGHYTYAFGVSPSQKAVNGKGTAATITFTARGGIGKQSQILILPESIVTAEGINDVSVLKSATGTTVVIGSATTEVVTPKVTVAPVQ